MTKQEAERLIAQHGSQRKAAQAAGVARKTLQKAMEGVTGKPMQTETRHGRTLADFRAEHDKDFIVPRRIRDGLKSLGAAWEYELAFAKLCGVGMADMATYREQFADHVVQIRRDGKRAWAGTKAMATEMRRMVS